MVTGQKARIIQDLQAEILRRQGFRPANSSCHNAGLGLVESAFPNGAFPLGAIHEFISEGPTNTASTNGFIAGILSTVMGDYGTTLWISRKRSIFPVALRAFGIAPDRFLFAVAKGEKEILWTMNEALKCNALSAVIGEVNDFNFMASRKLQLAVEESKVTGFVLRNQVRTLNPTAAVSRWRITSMPTQPRDGVPGVGFSRWQVELLKVRNGQTGVWQIEWLDGKFVVDQITMEGSTRFDQTERIGKTG
jgi:protein ImuA